VVIGSLEHLPVWGASPAGTRIRATRGRPRLRSAWSEFGTAWGTRQYPTEWKQETHTCRVTKYAVSHRRSLRTYPHASARLCGMNASTAGALDALLAKHRIELTADEVLGELDSAFAAIPGTATLSATEVDFLRQHAEPAAVAVIDAWSAGDERQARARIALRQLTSAVSGSVSIKEAATILGVDRSRVSRRITGKALWGFDLQGSRRIPRWQFLGDELLPGLDVIVPAIPRDSTPAVVDVFMHTPAPDFGDRTPIEYLAAGGDPALVAGFIEDLGRW